MRAGRGEIDWHFASIVVSLMLAGVAFCHASRGASPWAALRSEPVSLNGAEWHLSGTN